MADFTVSDLTLQTHAALTHPDINVGSAVDVDTFLAGKVYIYHANTEVTANATGVSYILQASSQTTGNEDWVDITEIVTGTTAANLAAIAGTEAAAETTLAVGAGEEASFAVGQKVYIWDTSTEADSEWGQVDVLPTNVITVMDGLTNGKDSADKILNQAELFFIHLDLAGVRRMRLIVLHRAATGSNIAFKANVINATDIE